MSVLRFPFLSYSKWLTYGTLFYLLVPFLLFLTGWIRPIYGLPACLVLLICAYRFIIQIRHDILEIPPLIYRGGVLLLAIYWCFIAGLGEWMPQSSDFFKHNLILADLVRFDWPVRYQQQGKPFLCYYLAWYLPIALLGKTFGIQFVPIISFVWSLGALFLIFNWVLVIGGRYRIGALIGFALLSGPNLIRFLIQWLIKLSPSAPQQEIYKSLPPLVSYSYPIKQWLYIPQQVIGGWLVMGWVYVELFQQRRYTSVLFIIGLGLFYSPFAIFGILPLIIAGWPSQWRQFISIPNLIGFPVIFFLLSSYYSAHYPLNASGWNIPTTLPKIAFLLNTLVADVLLPFLLVWLFHQQYKALTRQQMSFIKIASLMKFLLAFYFVGYNNDLLMNATLTISSLFFILMGIALQQTSAIPSMRRIAGFITVSLVAVSSLPLYMHVSRFVNYSEIRLYATYYPTIRKTSNYTINDLDKFVPYRFRPGASYNFSQQYLGNPDHFFNRNILK